MSRCPNERVAAFLTFFDHNPIGKGWKRRPARQGRFFKRRRTTATCTYPRSSCRGQNCGAVCSSSAPFMCSAALRHTLKTSIRANRPRGCLRIVARHVIAARAGSPKGASVRRSSYSCESITRAIRARPGNSLPIWRPSTVHEAPDRELRRLIRRILRPGQLGPRSVRPCRCRFHPLDRIEIGEEQIIPAAGSRYRLLFSLILNVERSGVSKTQHRL